MKRALDFLFVLLAVVCLMAFLNGAYVSADPLSDAKERPLNKGEQQFVERIIAELNKQFPSPGEGWTVEKSVYIGQHIYRGKGKESLTYDFLDKVALPVNIRFDFKQLSKTENADMKKAARLSANMGDLQEEMMKALQRGDQKEVERITQKMAAMQKGAYIDQASSMREAQAGGRNREKTGKFYVSVLVNKGGETIGKKYDSSAPGVSKAFKKERKGITEHKYYIGPWIVREADRVNWGISLPADMDTPSNHLRVVTMRVLVSGDSEVVNEYVKKNVRTRSLKSLIQ